MKIFKYLEHSKITESVIKNPYDLIIGNKYRITHPNYDELEEPEIEIVEVIQKHNNGFLLKNNDSTYELSFNVLRNCIIEEI